MNKSRKENIDKPSLKDTDSAFIGINNLSESLDLGGLFSHQFTNITPVYSSSHGPTEIYSGTRYGKRFILKGLKEQYRNDPIYTIALAKEFEIGITLEHHGIRRTLSIETVGDIGLVIVLEYVDGCSLETIFASGCLSLASARAIAVQLADALRYIHSKQVFHRDLKPSNILVSHSGSVVKIIDFNLSDSDDFIVLKIPAGSKNYMAPEQMCPDAKPSAVADIYSFGVVLDELASATGDRLLAQVAKQCVSHNPDKRPQSVAMIKLPGARQSAMETLTNLLSSKILTYILCGVCLVFAAAIVIMLNYNS
ncbi:serine/threonine protein kinase [Muribaculum intestinale]|uniref:serine/threonine protein kinase n=1 Tax=Muribaculum intestinale TaxID=1796646 RepID=UPI00242E8423|nr:protein kinase [Muribaculum intestinale]